LVANPKIDRGNSDFDIRHSFTAGVTYNLPSPQSNSMAHAALGGWSVDSFIFVRTAPPVNVVSGIVFADGIALYPRPDVVPGVPPVLYGSQYPGGKILNGAPLPRRPPGSRAISGAMCYAASELGKLISRFSGNFALPRRWGFVCEASSSTSSTTRTSGPPTTT
jgi:hypothetical protein